MHFLGPIAAFSLVVRHSCLLGGRLSEAWQPIKLFLQLLDNQLYFLSCSSSVCSAKRSIIKK